MKNILLVEDEAIVAMITGKMLEYMGYEVVDILKSSEEVLNFYSTPKSVDLILMDVKLKGNMDGIELVKKLRNDNISTHVIFITGNSDLKTMESIYQINNSSYLIKPVTEIELRKKIEFIKNV
jgi:two-component system, response regulator PdtaR